MAKSSREKEKPQDAQLHENGIPENELLNTEHVYDIANCGPRNRFWANGQIVSNCNIQNLPRGGELRKSLLAPPGHVVVVSDSAQIEARMIAWLAGETEVLKLFRNEEDVYSHMASQIYGVPLEHITKPLRFVGKTAVLGLAYGMGWRKFHATLTLGLMGPKMALEPEEAQNIVNGFRRARAKTVAYWRTCDDILQHMLHDMDGEFGILQLNGAEKKLYLPNGMYLEYPGLCQSNDGFVYFDYENADIMARGGHPNPKRGKKIYGGKCCENISQALARIVIGEQLLTIAKRYKIATTTHDEIVAIAPEDEADEALEFMLATMRTPPVWAPDLPLNADGGFAREYSK